MTEWDELRAKAEAATPGPWYAGDVWVFTDPVYPDSNALSDVLGGKFADPDRAAAERARGLRNAEYIAAASPENVLALIAELTNATSRITDALKAVGPDPSLWAFSQIRDILAPPPEHAADALTEPPAEDSREAIEAWSFEHRPILSFHDGHIASCKCMDRVFINGNEDWDTHITDAFLDAFAVTPKEPREG